MSKVSLIFFAFLCTISFYGQNQNKTLVDGVFAVIGSHVIFYSDIDDQLMQYRNQGMIQENESEIQEKIVEDLFFQKLLLHFADVDSIEVDEVELQNSINQRIIFFEEQLGSKENVENYFDKTISDLTDELKPVIKNQTLIQKMQYEITKNIKVSPADVEQFYLEMSDSLPLISSQFQVAQILKIPEAANLAIEETLSKLEDLRNRIVKGADFATMAILYSEDPGSSRNGGAYYEVKKGKFVKEFESVAFSLGANELSEIFKTEYGYHIAELIERRGNELDIRHILMTPKVSNADLVSAKDFLDSLKIEIMNSSITFELAAKQFSSDKDTRYNGGLLINVASNTSFFSAAELDPVVLNEVNKLSIGDITQPIYIKLDNGKEAYRIIKLVGKIDEHIANLEDDYAFLKNYCFQMKTEKELKKWYKESISNVYVQTSEDLLKYNFYHNLFSDE
jgi:peptidyl-prolyl cis-trans isomerase SurA